MSYLEMLSRASESPATDYHLCLLEKPSHRVDFYGFFTSDPISTIWAELEILEKHLFYFERKHNIYSKTIFQSSSASKQVTTDNEDMEKWTNTYQAWLTCKKNYKDKITDFLQESDIAEQHYIKKKSKTDRIMPENSEALQSDKHQFSSQSGVEFLLSIAGMFASEPSNTSENVEPIVTNFILKKYGKTNDDIAD